MARMNCSRDNSEPKPESRQQLESKAIGGPREGEGNKGGIVDEGEFDVLAE